MKRKNLITLSIALILVLSILAGCGTITTTNDALAENESKYVGTFESSAAMSYNIAIPYNGSKFMLGNQFVLGTRTLVLNNNGTGTYTFTMDKNFNATTDPLTKDLMKTCGLTDSDVVQYLSGLDYILAQGDLTWEVIDDCIYINGTINYTDCSGGNDSLNMECELKGKTLMYLDGTNSGYTRIS